MTLWQAMAQFITRYKVISAIASDEPWEELTTPDGTTYYVYCNTPRWGSGNDVPVYFDDQIWRVGISAHLSEHFDLKHIKSNFWAKLAISDTLRTQDTSFDEMIRIVSCDAPFLEKLKKNLQLRQQIVRLIHIGVAGISLTPQHLIFTMAAVKPNSIPLPYQKILKRLVSELLELKSLLEKL